MKFPLPRSPSGVAGGKAPSLDDRVQIACRTTIASTTTLNRNSDMLFMFQHGRTELARFVSLCAVAAGICSLAAPSWAGSPAKPPAANWSGFLAKQVQADSASDKLPLTWTPADIRWTADLQGYGQSSPVVWGKHVYVTSAQGDNKETLRVTALNLASGKTAWSQAHPSSDPVKVSYLVSRAAPSPVCDAAGVYAFFESGDLCAFDHEGVKRWNVSLSEKFGKFKNKFGLSASLVQTPEAVIALIDHDGPSYLVAINKSDGSVRWKTSRGEAGRSWSSPGLVKIGGKMQIVCSSGGTLNGYDPQSGKRLWQSGEIQGNTAATPIDLGGYFLTASLIRPSDGTGKEAAQSNRLIEVKSENGGFRVKTHWIAARARGSFSSPVASGEEAYWINPTGVLYCLDRASGKQHYAQRLPCGPCWATPLIVGDRLYCIGKSGVVAVLKRGPQFKVLAGENRTWSNDESEKKSATSTKLRPEDESSPARRQAAARNSGPVQYAAIVTGNRLLIRTGDRVFCIAE